jgi:hypothetical protein
MPKLLKVNGLFFQKSSVDALIPTVWRQAAHALV